MHINIKMYAVLLLVFCIVPIFCEGDEGVFGKIKSGFAYAGKILGLDRASEVAKLVSQAFGGRTSRKGDTGDPGSTLFSGFLRVLGFDTKRIGAIAVNAIIFIAQIISTSLSKPPPAFITSERSINGTPLEWMLENSEVKQYLKHAKNKNLPTQIINYLKEGNGSDSTGCIQLLICKTAPLVWGMQRAISAKGKNIVMGKAVLTEYLPSYDEIADHGDACEVKYPYCKLYLT